MRDLVFKDITIYPNAIAILNKSDVVLPLYKQLVDKK